MVVVIAVWTKHPPLRPFSLPLSTNPVVCGRLSNMSATTNQTDDNQNIYNQAIVFHWASNIC